MTKMTAIELPGGWKVLPAEGHNPCYLVTPENKRCQVMEAHTADALVRFASEMMDELVHMDDRLRAALGVSNES